MESFARAGRMVGALILVQMVGATLVNFGLEAPLFGSPGFLRGAASHSNELGLAVVLGLITEAMWIVIAIIAFPVLKQRTPSLALWLLVLSGVVLAAAVVEGAAVMSMVSLSEAYAKASGVPRDQFETIRGVVAAARNWPHFLARILDGLTIFSLNLAFFRAAVIPRLLAGLGLLAALLQMAGVGVAIFGQDVIFPMLAPLGLCQLTLSVWLMVRGFRNRLA